MTELGWRWEALQAIKAIEETRQNNNIAWMGIIRLAIAHAPPEELKKVLGTIRINDFRVNELWTQLIGRIPD